MPRRKAWLILAASVLALAALAALLPVPWSAQAWSPIGRGSPSSPDAAAAALLVTCAAAVWLLLAWSTALGVLAGLAGAPGLLGRMSGRWLSRLAPAAVRRLLIAAVGVTMLSGFAGCATAGAPCASTLPGAAAAAGSAVQAAPGWVVVSHPAATAGPSGAGTVRGVPSPPKSPAAQRVTPRSAASTLAGPTSALVNLDWPAGSSGGIDLDWPGTSDKSSEPVVVVRGDTLWSIAARHLPAHAEPGRIDATWRAWYTANRTVIGPNPDLILPGQRLSAPGPETEGPS